MIRALRLNLTTSARIISRNFSGSVSVSDSVSSESVTKNINHAGQYYQDLVKRGSKGKLLAVGDLRKLMQLCQKPYHVKYAVLGIKYYQKKGHDFRCVPTNTKLFHCHYDMLARRSTLIL
jgi:hypothetical protein